MFGKEEGKDKPKKIIINDRDPRSRSRDQRRKLATARSRDRRRELTTARSRDRHAVEGEIAINCAIDASRDRDLRGDHRTGAREIGAAWSSESAGDRRTDWNVSSPLARARSTLSLSFSGNALK